MNLPNSTSERRELDFIRPATRLHRVASGAPPASAMASPARYGPQNDPAEAPCPSARLIALEGSAASGSPSRRLAARVVEQGAQTPPTSARALQGTSDDDAGPLAATAAPAALPGPSGDLAAVGGGEEDGSLRPPLRVVPFAEWEQLMPAVLVPGAVEVSKYHFVRQADAAKDGAAWAGATWPQLPLVLASLFGVEPASVQAFWVRCVQLGLGERRVISIGNVAKQVRLPAPPSRRSPYWSGCAHPVGTRTDCGHAASAELRGGARAPQEGRSSALHELQGGL